MALNLHWGPHWTSLSSARSSDGTGGPTCRASLPEGCDPPSPPSRCPQAPSQAAQCKDGRTSIEATSVGSSAGKHLQLRSAYRAQRQAPLPLRFAPNVSVRVAFVRNIRHE